ncbi:MAG: site-specific DNA-methyltransferase [Alicyclobacillaceae bacterium]|nr:site-specific DNA-methyltransferase [Alicyclobacillaceae bacterium]
MLEFNRTYTGDNLPVLRSLRDAGVRFDLILTDPPYNLGKDFGNASDRLSLDEFVAVTRERVALMRDLLTERGSLVWFCIHRYLGYVQLLMYEAGLFYRRILIWHYANGFSRSQRAPATAYEPVLWFSRSDRTWVYNADDVRVPYKTQRVRHPVYYRTAAGERRAWRPNPGGALRSDVWSYPTLAGKRFAGERTGHPAQKPESLITDLIRAFCPKDEKGRYCGRILDPFHGSGTVGVCCERLNSQGHRIQWMGIELEPRWHAVAEARLAQVRRLAAGQAGSQGCETKPPRGAGTVP